MPRSLKKRQDIEREDSRLSTGPQSGGQVSGALGICEEEQALAEAWKPGWKLRDCLRSKCC